MNLMNKGPLGPKNPPLVSKQLRNSAEGEECTLNGPNCNHDTATTVLCHLRFFNWAGISQKPHDFLAAYGCSACHDDLDKRTGAIGHEDILRALGKTLMRLYQKGLLTVKGQKP